MQVIGFNFTKMHSEKSPEFKQGSINTNIEFTDLQKEKVDILKDLEAVKINFSFSINYGDVVKNSDKKNNDKKENENKDPADSLLAQIKFDGLIVLSTSKDELKDLQKSWKKKELPQAARLALFNMILKKTAPRALQLQDELNLPSHIPIPQVQSKPNTDQ